MQAFTRQALANPVFLEQEVLAGALTAGGSRELKTDGNF